MKKPRGRPRKIKVHVESDDKVITPPKFEVTIIEEDLNSRQVAKLLQVPESTLNHKLNQHDLGYRRGGGNYRYVSKEDIEKLKVILKR